MQSRLHMLTHLGLSERDTHTLMPIQRRNYSIQTYHWQSVTTLSNKLNKPIHRSILHFAKQNKGSYNINTQTINQN